MQQGNQQQLIRENILHLTSSCLSHTISNDQRQQMQQELFQMENNCNSEDFLGACNSLLLDVDYAMNPQQFQQNMNGMGDQYLQRLEAAVSFCAQVITRWLASGYAPANKVNFLQMHAILTGHLCVLSQLPPAPPLSAPEGQQPQNVPQLASPLRRVHSVSLSKVILACAKYMFPQQFPSLFEPFLNIADRSNPESSATYTPLLQKTVDAWQLVEFYICNIVGIDELHPGPRHLVELEKRALSGVTRNAHGLIICLFGAMENFPGGVNDIPLPIYTSLINIIESLVQHCKPEILVGRPAQLVLYGLRNRTKDIELVSACGSLFASMCAKRGIINSEAREWLKNIIDSLDGLLAQEMWDSISCFLEGFEELPVDSLQNVAPEVAELVGKILRTRSLFFSHKLLPILNKLLDSAIQQGVNSVVSILPPDLIHSIFELAPRWKSHPRFANDYQSASMSEQQFVSDDQYDATFGEFRAQASRLLKMYAQVAPKQSAETLTNIILNELRPPNNNEATNRCGHVTFQTPVFFAWDASLFCIEHLSHCYEVEPKFSAGPVQPAWDALIGNIGKNLNDAVLAPLYLNMMAALWKAPDIPWTDSVDLLLHYAALKPQNPQVVRVITYDQDLMAARRRALTLLVRICTDHGAALAPFYDELWRRMQVLQCSGNMVSSETNFILEAATSLSNAMSDDQQKAFLDNFVNDPAQRVMSIGSNCNPEKLRDLLFASGPRDNQNTPEQQTLMDDLGLLVGVCRRCAGKNYARNLMQNLIGPITNLTGSLHELHATVPPQFSAVFELPEEVADAMNQQQGSRHGAVAQANSNHQVDPGLRRIRGLVSKLRVNLYHLLPIAMKIFGSVTDQIAFCLEGIKMASLPLHVAKAAVDNLFVLAIELYPPCLPLCTKVVSPLFITAANRHTNDPNANYQNQMNRMNNNHNGRNNHHNNQGGNNSSNVMISRQLFFIYKNFYSAITKHVLATKIHERDRTMCVAVAEFLRNVIENCQDALLASSKDAAALVSDIPDDQIAGELFASLLRAIGGLGQGLGRRELENVAGDVLNVYIKNFERFSRLLPRVLPPHFKDLVHRFHGTMSTLQRFIPKRTKFIEFCVQLCS